MLRRVIGHLRRRLNALRPRVVVLMYHRVAVSPVDPWNLSVSPRSFQEQIEALTQQFSIIPLKDVPAHVAKPWPVKPAVAVTFDDGYRDNLLVAKPILEKYGCPATFFVCTGFVGTREGFWWDELALQALGAERLPSEIRLSRGDTPLSWKASSDGDRQVLLNVLWRHFRDLPHNERPLEMQALGEIFGQRPEIDEYSQPITAAEMRELAGPLFEIGAHSVTHPAMHTLPRERQLAEALESKASCEKILGSPVTSFAFPFGDHDDACVEAVRRAGCNLAVTTECGAVSRRSDPLRYPRLQVENISGAALCAVITAVMKDEQVAWKESA